MDIQHQRQNHSGQEVHSMVHLCSKCGWPYPNPHPSAKHRRSHNRVCGSIEGYKSVVDSGSRSNVPEDDHDHDHEHSDEEHHAPSTGLSVLERSLNDGGKEVHSMVHLCPKCGWPYPNPHPSAKHRRSHNRVCGTIEGYKSVVDSGSPSNVPEDDHDHDHDHSDEEHHAPRQEVHSMVHLCPKCGWPYPNPHPSAKHRRSHNRVCGTIEGYKSVVDSGSRSNVPEDDHDHDHDHSDEEHHAPSTGLNVLERSLNDGGSKEISERPIGSKEEVAVTHFPDGAPTPQVQVSSFTVSEAVGDDNKNLIVDLNGLQAHEDRTTGEEIGQNPSDSSDSSTQNLLEPKNASQELSGPEIKEPSTGSAEQGEAKFVEAPNDLLNQSNGVAAASLFCIGSETPMNSSAKADGSTYSEIVNEQSADDLMKEGDIIAKEQTRLMSSLPSKDADVISAVVPSEGFTSMEEGCIDAVSTAHQSETPDSVSSGIFSAENLKEDKNFPVYVVPEDMQVIERPERLIEGYKDYSSPKLHLPEDMDLPETILQKEDSFVPVSEDNSLSEMKVQEEVEVPSSDCILPKDKSEPDDNLKELKEDVPIIQVVVGEKTLTANESRGDNACKSEKLEAKGIDQDLSKVNLPVESSIFAFHEIEAPEISNNSSENNLSESDEKHCPIAPELPVQQNEAQDKSMINLIEVERASDAEKPETERVVVSKIETREGYFEGNDNLKATAAESAVSASSVESTLFDGVSGNDTANVLKEVECSEYKGELSVRDAENNSESTIKYQVDKEAGHVQAIDPISSGQSSVTVENNQSRDPSVATAKIPIEDEDVDNFVIVGPVVASAPERSTDLNSQIDSLEANWGSISVLSTQSDPFIATESALLTPAHEVASTEAGESIIEAEEKGSEKTDAFEAPSFLTLVEHGVGANQTGGALAQQEGKKNGEIISNQGAGKHHSPLKNLLVEATQESKLKSSCHRQSFASVQRDETTAVTTVGKIPAADDHRKSRGSVKEWDAPAKKVKGHWMPFICCSSVN